MVDARYTSSVIRYISHVPFGPSLITPMGASWQPASSWAWDLAPQRPLHLLLYPIFSSSTNVVQSCRFTPPFCQWELDSVFSLLGKMSLSLSVERTGFVLIHNVDRLITINHDWRVIYEVAAAFIGAILLLAFFAFPETAFSREEIIEERDYGREPRQVSGATTLGSNKSDEKAPGSSTDHHSDVERTPDSRTFAKRKSYIESLRLYNGVFTTEPLYKIFLRPFGLICLPPVLWSALVESVTIGFLVAVSSNVDTAFSDAYDFESWQVGLCFISACLGSIIGIPAGGKLGDFVADYFTKKNDGIREPEMRLPAMIPSLITTPLALTLYGVGIEKRLHWICPTIGLGLCKHFLSAIGRFA